MTWKNWGDHPVVVTIGLIIGISGFGYTVYDHFSKQGDTVNKPPSTSTSTSISRPAQVPVQLAPLPKEIIDEIRKRPPLQQDEAAKHYVGQRFKWHVTLSYASEVKSGNTEQGIVRIGFKDRGRDSWVRCSLSLAEYPSLKTTKEGADFYITGTVSEVDSGINLIDVTLEPYSQTKPKPL
jgi:hypothetical protein